MGWRHPSGPDLGHLGPTEKEGPELPNGVLRIHQKNHLWILTFMADSSEQKMDVETNQKPLQIHCGFNYNSLCMDYE